MPAISIIIPVYNAEKYLYRCLTSIQNQTFPDIEVICVNDGSNDKSGEICESFAKDDKRIKVIHTPNNGAAKARKIGFLASKGEYVGFVDADDWVEVQMYETLYQYCKFYNAEISICRFFDGENNNTSRARKYNHFLKAGLYVEEEIKKYLYPQLLYSTRHGRGIMPPGLTDKLFKKSLLSTNIKYVNDLILMNEDQLWAFPCVIDCKRIYVCTDFFYHYRTVENSVTRRYKDNFAKDIQIYINAIDTIVTNKGMKEFFEKQIEYCFTIKMINFITNELKNNALSTSAKASVIKLFVESNIENISLKFTDIRYLPCYKDKIIWLLAKYRMFISIVVLHNEYKILKFMLKK